MIDLILLTAGYRLNNIEKIAKSVVDVFLPYKNQFKITWLICKDQYNGFGDLNIDRLFKYLNNQKMYLETYIVPTGKPNQKNYGGDSFNPVLDWYFSDKNYTYNPWIYILDDDNVVHHNLPRTLLRCNYLNKDIIWLNRIRETGLVDHACRLTALKPFELNDGSTFIPAEVGCDPSQLVIKWSIIQLECGYGTGFRYDFDWCYPLCKKYIDKVAFYEDYDEGSIDEKHCYHNGLRSEEELNEFDKLISEGNQVGGYFTLDVDGTLPKIFPVSRELTKTIYELIKKEYKDIDFQTQNGM